MKIKNNNTLYVLLIIIIALFSACEDEDLSNDAAILHSFSLTGKDNTYYKGVINDDNTITVKISPYIDATAALDSALAKFYLTRGATVIPDPSIPQNFAQEGGVKYTVVSQDKSNRQEYIVTWGASDHLPDGAGFSYAEIGAMKQFPELGYPGEYSNWTFPDSKMYGDLNMYHAYCGDYIVMLSRAYIDANPNSDYAIKVVDKDKLDDAGSLNLGSISVVDLKVITSDYKGNMVGLVVKDGKSELFYWSTTTGTPKSVGTIDVNLAESTDGSSYLEVAGDITNNAWITALAKRGPKGEHYRVKVTNGTLSSDYSIIETGYSSGDSSGFQMISPLDDSDKPSFVVGDTEGAPNAANSIHAYVNTFAGSTIAVMPPLWQNTLQTWWVGTGFALSRIGGRSPYVTGMVINGKSYVVVTSGTAWWHSAAVLTSDLQTLAHENLNIADTVSRAWSFGSSADWYWNQEDKEGYLSVWFGRFGLFTYKMTCFE